MANISSAENHGLGPVSEVKAKWGWFVALGVGLLILGFIAATNLLVATVASVFYVGIMMLIGGIIEIFHSFSVKSWGSFFWWFLSGLLYAAAGVLTFMNPALATAILTFILCIALIASGILKIWVGFTSRADKGWGWIVAAGVVTVIAGLILASGWPVNSLWLLGLFLAIDLIFQGWSFIIFGFALKKA